jgi:hypothetical protein
MARRSRDEYVPSRMQCEYCSALATHMVDAQWTLFDFITEQVCGEHLSDSRRLLWERRVDGQPCEELSIRLINWSNSELLR